ncbi:MAG: hypothetical protein ACLQPH_06705, partial [Acidimicrobiales bacterium]
MSLPPDEFGHGEDPRYPRLNLADREVPDQMVHRAVEVVEAMGVIDRIEGWEQEARNGPGGRPRTFTMLAMLTGFVIVTRMGEAV